MLLASRRRVDFRQFFGIWEIVESERVLALACVQTLAVQRGTVRHALICYIHIIRSGFLNMLLMQHWMASLLNLFDSHRSFEFKVR